jgi:dynamin 1-like protein
MAVVSERMSAKKNPPPIMDTLQGKNPNEKPKPPPPTLQQAAALNRDPNQDLIDQTNQGFFGSFFKQKPSTPGQLSQVFVFDVASFHFKGIWKPIRARTN